MGMKRTYQIPHHLANALPALLLLPRTRDEIRHSVLEDPATARSTLDDIVQLLLIQSDLLPET